MSELLDESNGKIDTACPCCFTEFHIDAEHLGAIVSCPKCARLIELVRGVCELIPTPDFKSGCAKERRDTQ